MAEKSAEGGLELRARLITVPFNDLPGILRGAKKITNIPATAYIRTLHVNLKAEVIELMIIDMAYSAVVNLGDMPAEAAAVAGVDAPVKKKRK